MIPDSAHDFVFHRLPSGIMFHPAPSFVSKVERPIVAIVTHLDLFPALHGFRVAVLQLAMFLNCNGYCTVLVDQAKHDDNYRSCHQTICDRHFDATFYITRQTKHADAAKGDYVAQETLGCIQWIEETFGLFAVIAEYSYMAPCLSQVPTGVLRLVQTIDVVSRLPVETLRANNIRLDRELVPEDEVRLLDHADVLIAITEVEKRILEDMLPTKRVITVGYAVASAACVPSRPESRDLLLVASSNPFNRDGAVRFIEDVLPAILKAVPDARLLLAGQICSRIQSDGYAEALTAPGVVPLGPVDDVAGLYRTCATVINPTRFGTGLKIKTVEAIGAGRVVVTTSVGCEGLHVAEPQPFVEANGPDAFAAACIQLLQDVPTRHARERTAADYARRYFATAFVYRELGTLLDHQRAQAGARRLLIPLPTFPASDAVDVIKWECRDLPIRVLEIGHPTDGMLEELSRHCTIVDLLRIRPNTSLDKLDSQWMSAAPGQEPMRSLLNARFRTDSPRRVLATSSAGVGFDLLYLHGEHRLIPLLSDLLAWIPRLKAGGLLVVADYGDPAHPEVSNALDNFCLLHFSRIASIQCVSSSPLRNGRLHGQGTNYTALVKLAAACPDLCADTPEAADSRQV